jgi:voltage-gated potassium channel
MESKRMQWAFIFLISIFAIGVGGYMLIERWSFFDALYMVVITLATVGYSETHPLSLEGRIFTIVVIVLWVGIGVYAVSSIMKPIIEGEIRRVLGRRKLEKEIRALRDHYIICGFGRMGKYISRELQNAAVPYLVLEKDATIREKLEREKHNYLFGDATEDEVLIQAGVERARGLVAVVASDADNVYITLTARELNPNIFILARSTDESSEAKLKRAGVDKVISPYHMGAVRMVQAILRPAVVDFIEIAFHGQSMELQLEEFTVNSDSTFAGATLKEGEIRKNLGVIIVAVKDSSGRMVFNPSSDYRIGVRDTLIALGKINDLLRLERILNQAK